MPSSNAIAPASSIARFQLSTVNARLFSSKPFSFTYFRKNASANPYGSHTYKTKDLKPFRFTYLQKKGGVAPPFSTGHPARPEYSWEGLVRSMPVPTPSGRGFFGSGHRSRAPYASPDSCRDESPVTSHNSRPRALRVPLLPLGFSVRLPTSGLELPRRHGLRITDRWSQLTCYEPHALFACAPHPPDSRFSPLLGAIGATASIHRILV